MPASSDIYGQIRQPEAYNPLTSLTQAMQVKGLQNQGDLAQYTLNKAQREDTDNNALRAALATPGADPYNELIKIGRIKEASEYQKNRNDTRKTDSEISKNDVETEHKTIGIYRDASQAITDPMSAVEFVKTMHADPRLKNSAIARVPLEQALSQIPQDPAQLSAWKQQFALGAAKYIEANKPTYQTRNLGGTTDTIALPGLGGAPSIVNSMKNSMTPGDSARLAQTERHFQAGQNAPQYMETDAGLVALPKKLAAGQVPTGTPVMGADGQPLGKPLKPIPATANSAIIQNTQSINNIDRALKLLGGENVGDPKAGGMQGDKAATGLKGYLPNGLLNRIDPKGVDARAEISDIGSLKIHDRSGAAVTLSEAPRLMPFIPLATDDDATVVKKLNRLKIELKNESQAMQDTYSKDNGYKPSAVKPAGALNPDAPKAVNFGDLK